MKIGIAVVPQPLGRSVAVFFANAKDVVPCPMGRQQDCLGIRVIHARSHHEAGHPFHVQLSKSLVAFEIVGLD